MANISILSRVINGLTRNVDLSANTLVVGSLNTGVNTLTDTILGRLLSLQNGTDVGTGYHTHDTVYTRTTSLAATSGSTLIGDNNSYTNFTPASATVKAALTAIDSALGSAASALDGTFRIKNTATPTKQIAFDASGITAANTRTITMPDSNVNLGLIATAIQASGSVTFTANQPMGGFKLTGLAAGSTAGDSVRFEQAVLTSGANAITGNQSFSGTAKITNLVDPTAAQDGATKAYVDNALAGMTWKNAAVAASTADVTISSAPATLDGVTLASLDRIVLKNQALPKENGIYQFNGTGSALTRTTDADTWNELVNAVIYIQVGGAANGGAKFNTTSVTGTLGTTAITWTTFSAASALAGSGTAGYNSYWTAAQTLAAEQFVATTRGGLGADASGFTGILKFSAGTASASSLVNADVSVSAAIAYSKLALSNSIVNADIASAAAITYSKLALSNSIVLGDLTSNSVDENKIVSTALDSATMSGGSGAKVAVVAAPKLQSAEVANQSLSATTLVALRYAKAADAGFVAGRVSKADYDTTSADNFYVTGLAYPAGAVSAGGAVTVVEEGLINVPAHGFTVGTPVYLGASGAVTNTAPSTALQAVVKVGMVKDANNIWVQVQMMGVN